jgi:hypothetical protein
MSWVRRATTSRAAEGTAQGGPGPREHEEREEFPRLRSSLSPVQLEAMGVTVRVAEAMAPTHPHPEVNSLAANLMAGPCWPLLTAPATWFER